MSWCQRSSVPTRFVLTCCVGTEPHILISLKVKTIRHESFSFSFFNMKRKEVHEIFKQCKESVCSDCLISKGCMFSSKEKI